MNGMMGGRGMDGGPGRGGGMPGMMRQMMSGNLPRGIEAAQLPDRDSDGAQLVVEYCGQCHGIPNPALHGAEDWPSVAERMFKRMAMMARGMGMGRMDVAAPSARERRAIVAYLRAHALTSVAPEEIPAPSSSGARGFEGVCARCHPLPDPTIHTPGEWPAVVARMRAHIRAMEEPRITDQQSREIVAYLQEVSAQ